MFHCKYIPFILIYFTDMDTRKFYGQYMNSIPSDSEDENLECDEADNENSDEYMELIQAAEEGDDNEEEEPRILEIDESDEEQPLPSTSTRGRVRRVIWKDMETARISVNACEFAGREYVAECDDKTPIQYFREQFDEEIVNILVEESRNLYYTFCIDQHF